MKALWTFLIVLVLGCERPGDDSGATLIVAAESVHVVGTSESLAQVIDMHPSADGTVWILNAGEPYVIALGPDGAVASAAGRRGQGPREFRSPFGIVAGPEADDVWVYEESRQALLRVSGPQDEWRELSLPRASDAPFRPVTFDNVGMGIGRIWLIKLADGFVIGRAGRGEEGERRLWNAEILTLSADDASITQQLALAELLGDPRPRYGNAAYMAPYPIWAMCPDRSIVLYDPLQNAVHHVVDGRATTARALPPERRLEVTVDRVFAMLYQQVQQDWPEAQRPDSATMHESLRADFSAAQAMMSSVFPEYTDLQCASDGVVWIQPVDMANGYMGKGRNWLRIDADGATREVRLPERFRPYRFLSGRFWGVLRDELGVPSIAWIALR